MAQQNFTISGFGLRLAAALALVLLTFNPSGWSYYHWLRPELPHIQATTALAGIVLLLGWAVYVSATLRSLGLVGILLLAAFFAALVWVAVSYGILSLNRGSTLDWIVLLVLGLTLGIGMSWSILRQRLTGQTDVEETVAHL